MGAATVVAVSRNPGCRLDELADQPAATGTTLVHGGRRRSRRSRDERRCSTASAPTSRRSAGIYLAAFGGGPITLSRHDRRRRHARCSRPKLDALARAAQAVADAHRSASSCCSRRSRVCSARGGWRITPRPPPSWTRSPTRAAPPGFRPPPSTGDCGSRWPTTRSDEERQVTLDSGLEPMADEVAIQALCVGRQSQAPRSARRSSPPTGPTGHRVPHPGSAAHRRRPAAGENTDETR